MSYLVFARKYRPQRFEEVVRQEHVTRTLRNAIVQGRVSHALLFAGPRGTGKTTVARVLAKAMNCGQGPTPEPCNACRSCEEITAGHAADVFEIDGASNNSVDQIRELRDNLKYMPAHSRFKIYIIDEVHMLSTAAFNALLKTLEEPPSHVLFIFATTEPQKIPVTILSRCQRHDLRRIDLTAIVDHMHWICDQERIVIDDQSLTLIAREAGGSMRDALSLLDHVLACTQEQVNIEVVGELLGLVERRHLFEFSAALLGRDIQGVLKRIDEIWRSGYEIKRFYTDLVVHFHQFILVKLSDLSVQQMDLPGHEIDQIKTQVAQVPEAYLLQLMDLLFQAEPAIKMSSQPKLAIEMVFLKWFQTPPALSIDLLIERLDQLRTGLSASPPNEGISEAPFVALPSEAGAGAPTAPAPPPVMPALTGDTLWETVQSLVIEQRPALAGFLSKSRLKSFQADRLDIEVIGNEFVLKSIKKHLGFLEQICSTRQGRPVSITLSANIQDPAEKEEKKKEDDRLKRQTLSHPMVAEALDLFDAKVVDVKIME